MKKVLLSGQAVFMSLLMVIVPFSQVVAEESKVITLESAESSVVSENVQVESLTEESKFEEDTTTIGLVDSVNKLINITEEVFSENLELEETISRSPSIRIAEGSIRVCKMVGMNGAIISQGDLESLMPFIHDSLFELPNLRDFNVAVATMSLETPFEFNTDLLESVPGLDAICSDVRDFPEGDYYYSNVGTEPEVVTDLGLLTFDAPQYNDTYEGIESFKGEFFAYDDSGFASDFSDPCLPANLGRQCESDGHIPVSLSNPFKKDRTLVVFNNITAISSEVERGDIRICKVVMDEKNNILPHADLMALYPNKMNGFGLKISSPTEGALFFKVFDNDRFTGGDNYNTELVEVDLDGDGTLDEMAHCTTERNMPLGNYEYSREDIGADFENFWKSPLYNDEFHAVGAAVYSDYMIGFDTYNSLPTSDGIIELNDAGEIVTLVVVNRLAGEDDIDDPGTGPGTGPNEPDEDNRSNSGNSGSIRRDIAPQGEVLGAFTSEGELTGICPEFTHYLQEGDATNDPVAVKKIQFFLNLHMGESLAIDGVYGNATAEAVGRFQTKYLDLVLTPWEYEAPTKRWYKSTRAMANAIVNCPEGELYLEDVPRQFINNYSGETFYYPLFAVEPSANQS